MPQPWQEQHSHPVWAQCDFLLGTSPHLSVTNVENNNGCNRKAGGHVPTCWALHPLLILQERMFSHRGSRYQTCSHNCSFGDKGGGGYVILRLCNQKISTPVVFFKWRNHIARNMVAWLIWLRKDFFWRALHPPCVGMPLTSGPKCHEMRLHVEPFQMFYLLCRSNVTSLVLLEVYQGSGSGFL